MGKQTYIPGTEPKKDRSIHPLAESYIEAQEERKAAAGEETKARERLVAAMQRKGVKTYAVDDVEVELLDSTKVKAKRRASDEGKED